MINPTLLMCLVIIGVSALVGAIAYLTKRAKGKFEPMTDAQNDAVNAYLRANPAPSLLIDGGGVRPVYALDDRFMQKVSKLEINGKLYNVIPVWKQELIGVRSSGYFLECTAHEGPPLSFSKDSLRQLKKDVNLVLYCVTKVDFQDEEV